MQTPVVSPDVAGVLPPTSNVIIEHKSKSLMPATNLSWLEASPGVMPDHVITVAKVDGKPIYVCHARAFDGVQPGQLTKQGCVLTYAGASVVKKNYKVLAGTAKLVWRDPSVMYQDQYAPQSNFYGILPQGMKIDTKHYVPIIGGYESKYPNYLHPLYICSAQDGDVTHVGKVVGSNCNVAINGKEVLKNNYQVLSAATETLDKLRRSYGGPKGRALMFD
jgi:hypothetical protein